MPNHSKHALLEKPPAATLSELVDLEMMAVRQGRVLFTTWHAQYNAGVAEAQRRLAGHTIRKLLMTWKEDVRRCVRGGGIVGHGAAA